MTECIFCEIINNKIKSNRIWEDDYFIAIHNINPIAKVHILIIPKIHVSKIELLNGNYLKTLPECIEYLTEKFNIEKTGYRIIINKGKNAGQEINHLHLHLLGGEKLQTMNIRK